MTSICDERGQELIYAGMPITEVFKEEMGIGGVLGLLWFQRRFVVSSSVFLGIKNILHPNPMGLHQKASPCGRGLLVR